MARENYTLELGRSLESRNVLSEDEIHVVKLAQTLGGKRDDDLPLKIQLRNGTFTVWFDGSTDDLYAVRFCKLSFILFENSIFET